MKYGWIVMCLALLGLTLVAISLVSHPVTALEPQRLTKSYDMENDLHISDKYVVWTEPTPNGQDLYAYNIQTQITTNIGQMSGPIDLYYDKVVWLNNSGMYLVNMSNSMSPVFIKKVDNYYNGIGVWDNYIVYCNQTWTGPNHYLSAYKWDIKQGQQIPIWNHLVNGAWVQGIDVTNNRVIIYFQEFGNELAWMDISPPSGVQMVNIPGSSNCQLAGNPNDQVICNGYNGFFKVNLQSQAFEPVPIGLPGMGVSYFSFQGNTVLFTNFSSANGINYDLFEYDLNTKTTTQITYSTAMDIYGVLQNDKIAFISNREGFYDLYFFVFPPNPPDLTVHPWDIKAVPNNPVVNEPSKVYVTIYNQGKSSANANVTLSIRTPQDVGKGKSYGQVLGILAPGSSKILEFKSVNFYSMGTMEIAVNIKWSPNPGNPPEFVTDNNDAMTMVTVVDRPTVAFGFDSTKDIYTYDIVTLDSRDGTSDKDGIMLWIWDFGDGTTSLVQTPDHAWKKAGVYQIKLTVYDIYGTIGVGYKNISILDQWPSTVCTVPPVVARNTTVVLSCAGSYDPDGQITSAWWETDVGVRGGLEGLVVETSFSTPNASVNVTFHLVDDNWNESTADFTIRLVDATAHNVPPIAVIQLTGNGLNVSFSGLSSYDPNGKVVSYAWTFSDGSVATGPMVNKTFATGTYIATLKVKDNENLEGTTTAAFTLSYTAPPTIIQKVNQTVINQIKGNLPPTASASFTMNNVTKGLVNFQATAKDPDGTIAKYEWDFNGDGTWDYSSTTIPDTSYTYGKPGYYMALFRATDNNGTSTVVSLSIGVRTNEIGTKTQVGGSSLNMSAILLVLIISIVVAIAIAAVVGYVMSKKVAVVQKDMAAEQEVAEIKKLVEESKNTGANVDEAEALIRQFEGR